MPSSARWGPLPRPSSTSAGYRVGGAAISEKHAGFIVNLGGASCADVLAVAEDVSRIVKEKTGFVLEKEIRVVR